MEIIYSIAHKIIKDRREKGETPVPAQIIDRKTVFDSSSENVILLLKELLKVYKTGKTFGSFDQDISNHPFQTWLKCTEEPDYSEQKFIELSLNTVNRIKNALEKQNFATGGYIVFIHYQLNQQRYFMIVMIKDKGGLTFTDKLDLTSVQQIDLDKLHQAARIDLDRFYAAEESHLSFLKGGSKRDDVSAYFTDALGCTDLIQSSVATKNVFALVENIGDEAGLGYKEIKNITDNLHDFLKDRHPKTVNLKEIAVKLNVHLPLEYHDLFIEKANSEEFCVSQEFVPNLTALRTFKRIQLETRDWKLTIDKNSLGTPDSNAEIIFNADEKSLSINNLPDKLMAQLNQALAKRNG